MSQCNYCHLRDIRLVASTVRPAEEVTVEHAPRPGYPKGVDVMTHPPGETPDVRKHWVMWLAAVPDQCICGRDEH